jgi:hypothetical protein
MIIWFPYQAVHIATIERVQRRFLKYVWFRVKGVYPRIGFPQSELLAEFAVVGMADRCNFMFKLIYFNINCRKILSWIGLDTCHRARSGKLFYLRTPRTNLLNFSPIQGVIEMRGQIF